MIRIFSDTSDTKFAVAGGKKGMCWSGDRKVTVSGMETRGSDDAPGVSLLLLTQLPSINPQVSLILSYCGKLFLSGRGKQDRGKTSLSTAPCSGNPSRRKGPFSMLKYVKMCR